MVNVGKYSIVPWMRHRIYYHSLLILYQPWASFGTRGGLELALGKRGTFIDRGIGSSCQTCPLGIFQVPSGGVGSRRLDWKKVRRGSAGDRSLDVFC